MTTIAYRDGILAADSQLTMGDHVRMLSSDKIKILNKDTVFAGAGESGAIILAEKFFSQPDWEDKLSVRPELPKDKNGETDVEGILIFKGRVYLVVGDLIPDPLVHPFYAVGSGWEFAMAAMQTGMSATDAVKFASQLDVYTNDKIRYLNVEEFLKGKGQKTSKGRSRQKTGGESEIVSEAPKGVGPEVSGVG